MRTLLLLFVFVCLAVAVFSQSTASTASRPLHIGDTVPDIEFRNIINYPSKTLRLSDFRGKLVILDLWNTYCASCIEAFRKMQALQDEFEGKIQVLLVNPYNSTLDSKERVNRVLTNLKTNTGFSPTLPIPIHDTILNEFFPHATVPHVIVINRAGVILGITYSWFTKSENIQALVAGDPVHIPLKDDESFDKSLPLFVNGNGGDGSNFSYRSIITGYQEMAKARIGRIADSNGNITRLSIYNYPLLSLFQLAYPEIVKFPRNRILIHVANPSLFSPSENGGIRQNLFCYEIIGPPAADSVVQKYMRQDLERNFHIVARVETVMMKCYVLRVNGHIGQSLAKNEIPGRDMEPHALKKYLKNQPVSALTDILNYTLPLPVIDETGLNKNISMMFPSDVLDFDITKWKKLLSDNGFELVDDKRPLAVVKITDSF
ncbi:MAG TPA: redoxin domain-containing protein [Puia sp.]|nr:redoxin domain-containing protein [Puia sp.]